MSQTLVGIDLGTTNTAMAFAQPPAARKGRSRSVATEIKLLAIQQLIAPGEIAALPLLPSVRYHPAEGELAPGALQLPWPALDTSGEAPVVIGQWARQLGTQVPGRLVASAKSWLSHPTVDRLAPILPWGAATEVPKVSPVTASASYLAYLRYAWNAQHPDHPLEQQDIVLTVPASFDEAARALTLSAAHQAGLTKLRLLEEPQAVFYDWLFRHRSNLAQELAHTRLILVCDVGGGTTDLSLIKVDLVEGEPQITRIGVGKHLMLGGDNMDLALAHLVESRLRNSTPGQATPPLTASQLAQLTQRCRVAKEQLLAADAPEQAQVTLLGSGSRMIGGSRSVTLTRAEVHQILVDGFFPEVPANEPIQRAGGGIVEFGLPYARDPAITRHIAEFLRQHPQAMPDTLLLNGGVFRADALVQRLEKTLAAWRGTSLRLLHNDNPDVAVARGAVAFTLAQQGLAPRIGGGSPRSYFLLLDDLPGVQGAQPVQRAICVLPRGSESGQERVLAERTFALRLGQPVRFHLFTALADADGQTPFKLGELVNLNQQQFERLPPIATVLRASHALSTGATTLKGTQEVPVQLVTSLTEVGTLEMSCVSTADEQERWLLEFDLRQHPHGSTAAESPDPQARQAAARLASAIQKIDRIFGPGGQKVESKDVRQLRAQLEQILGDRDQWTIPVLRPLFDALWARAKGRRRSVEHERAWLNLAGYSLRPGFGDPLDEWRLQQLWTQFQPGVQFASDKQVCVEWWTLWRRVAGGLAAAEQLRLLDDFAFNLHHNEKGAEPGATKPVKGSDDDMLRLGASLERIPVDYKVEIGVWLLARLQKSLAKQAKGLGVDATGDSLTLWALGRLGARQPFYGHAHEVIPAEVVEGWINTLLALDWKRLEPAAFAATQIARMTGDRTRDLPLALREKIIQRLTAINAPPLWTDLVRQTMQLDSVTQRRLMGESLPPGLLLLD